MGFETPVSFASIAAVHAKPDVGHANPDGQGKRENRARQPRQSSAGNNDAPHPVPNAQGQITGKLIDITA
jgi:hypothetical protein